jgi:3-deoxy-D-manno-octulosonate 8-phosphate phosphatase (KDO 8-P phosphatase)
MKSLEKLKLIAIDVDGTLTDGTIYILENGEEIKGFNVKDGTGIVLAKLAGFIIVIISGKKSKVVKKRVEELKIDDYYEGVRDKKRVLEDVLKKYSLEWENCCFIGDDIGDLEVIKLSGFSASPKDAHPSIKSNVDFVSNFEGGKGAVREIIDFILKSQGKYEESVIKFNQIF